MGENVKVHQLSDDQVETVVAIGLEDWLAAAPEDLAGAGIAIGGFRCFEHGACRVDADELASDLREATG